MPASSQASRALSTASLTVVSRALRGLSNPSRWRFLAKNSLTEMSRWLAAIDCSRGSPAGVAVAGLGFRSVVVLGRLGLDRGGVAIFAGVLGHTVI